MTTSLPVVSDAPSGRLPQPASTAGLPTIAFVGNPNAGKTSLFNRLTGLRAKTANYPGTTVDHRETRLYLGQTEVRLVDLPGTYGLDASSPEEQVTCQVLDGSLGPDKVPSVVLLVVDATNLQRNLFLASQVRELGLPTVIALNMIDEAEGQGLEFDLDTLAAELGGPVIPVSARTGAHVARLLQVLGESVQEHLPTTARKQPACQSVCGGCSGCSFAARHDWAEGVAQRVVSGDTQTLNRTTQAIDRWVTHRTLGLFFFAAVMLGTFATIFWLASFPMDWMDKLFGFASQKVGLFLPDGDLKRLLTEGVIGGVGGLLIFIPQIFTLFFILSLLEDSGYLARAAFVMDRLMHRVGLPGKAFVPLLAAHACAIPAIMASRTIDDTRDRLNTILIIPLMTCTARMPVFAMVVALLFPDQPLYAALTFAAAYFLAIATALLIGFVFKRRLLPGRTKPLLIELPRYRIPSLRNSLLASLDRSSVFVRKAGTVILVFSIVLWVLATYPKATPSQLDPVWQQRLATAQQQDQASQTTARYDAMFSQAQGEYALAGRMGKWIQPIFAPLGFDWRLSVGIINSFAAREVMVSTLAVLYGAADEEEGLLESLRKSQRVDGSPVFDVPTCLSLLVFYIYAMQCFPTLAVVRRELKTWKWPVFMWVYMSALAYVAAWGTYRIASIWA